MDIRSFFSDRLVFVQQLYQTSIAPFEERKRKIRAGEEPYIPVDQEDDEPPFLEEWIEADESVQVLGMACLSMLLAALNAYLRMSAQLVAPTDADTRRRIKDIGWLKGYLEHFEKRGLLQVDQCPVNLKLVEEMILLRNRSEHLETLVSHGPDYGVSELRKLVHPFFIDGSDLCLLGQLDDEDRRWIVAPRVSITPEKFVDVVITLACFAQWIEDRHAGERQAHERRTLERPT